MQDDDSWLSNQGPAPEFDAMIEEWEEEQKRRFATCRQKIIACFKEVQHELGEYGYPAAAWELFQAFVQSPYWRPKRKKKGSHDLEYDRQLLAAYDAAPHGQKFRAALAVTRKTHVSAESIRRHLSRLLATNMQFEAFVHAANRDK
jgi:hypothetical protein